MDEKDHLKEDELSVDNSENDAVAMTCYWSGDGQQHSLGTEKCKDHQKYVCKNVNGDPKWVREGSC
jgi:hypothetical protein